MKLPFLRARQPPAKPVSSWGGLITISSACQSSCPPQAEPKAATPWPTAALASLKEACPLCSVRFWLEICFVGQGLSKPQEQSGLVKKEDQDNTSDTHPWLVTRDRGLHEHLHKQKAEPWSYSSAGNNQDTTPSLHLHQKALSDIKKVEASQNLCVRLHHPQPQKRRYHAEA